eukprot:7044620-Pyramimonas_sp.AAC.1
MSAEGVQARIRNALRHSLRRERAPGVHIIVVDGRRLHRTVAASSVGVVVTRDRCDYRRD